MYCGNCGTKIPEGEYKCPNCGEYVAAPEMKADGQDGLRGAQDIETDKSAAPAEPVAASKTVTAGPATAAPVTKTKPSRPLRSNGVAIAALACTIAGQVCCCMPLPQFLLGVAGLVLGILGIRTKFKPMAVVSIIFSVLSIICSITLGIVYAAWTASAVGNYYEYGGFEDFFNQLDQII